MALNVATLALILCRQVKTIKHGSVRINIVHFPIPCLLNFCSAVPTTFFSFLMIFLLVYIHSAGRFFQHVSYNVSVICLRCKFIYLDDSDSRSSLCVSFAHFLSM